MSACLVIAAVGLLGAGLPLFNAGLPLFNTVAGIV
jgi:hypothetical protein